MPSYLDYALAQAQEQGVDPALVWSIMQAESGGEADPGSAVSGAGAVGPMQLMPATAAMLGVDASDPLANIRGGVQYLGRLSKRFGGDPRLVAAAYNAGPTAVARSLKRTGDIPNYPETQAYVDKVTAAMSNGNINPDWLEPANGSSAAATAAPTMPAEPQPVKINPKWLEGASDATAAPAAAAAPAKPLSFGEQAMRQLGLTGRDVLAGGTKLLGLVGDPLNLTINKVAGTHLQPVSVMGDELADKMGLPRPQGALENVVNTTAQGLVGTGGMMGVGRGLMTAAKPVARAIGAELSSNGAAQGAGAVTGSLAAQGADKFIGQHVNSPTARALIDTTAALIGGMPGAGAAGRMSNGVADADVAATMAAAREAGVPVQASDLNARMQGIKNTIADKIPFGNLGGAKVPEAQVQGVRKALSTAADKYRPAGLDDTAGAAGTDRFLAADLRKQYGAAKQATNKAYDKVQAAIADAGEMPPIDLDNTKAAVEQLHAEFPETFRNITLSSSARRALGILKKGTIPPEEEGPQTVSVGGVKMDVATMNPAMRASLEKAGVEFPEAAEAPQVSFQEARKVASELWNAARRAQRAAASGSGSISQEQVGALKHLAGAVQSDVDAYMASAPEDVRNAYAAADATFKQRVLPFRADPKVYSIVSSHTPQEARDLAAQGLYNNLFNTAQGERSAMALGLMSKSGKQAAAYQALKEAADKGLSSVSPTGLKIAAANRALDAELSPALENIARAYPQFAQDAGKLQRLLQIGRTAAADIAKRHAATGVQNVRNVTAIAQIEAARRLAEHLGPVIGYGLGVGGPVGAANLFNLLNRRLPGFILANPGSKVQRVAPPALQGLLQANEEKPR